MQLSMYLARHLLAALLMLTPLLGGCLSQVGEVDGEEVGAARSNLTGTQRRDRAGDIRDAAAARGMTEGWLLAGIADAETQMSHCWSELTWACQGPTSPDCGGGPIVAGAGDGACSLMQGGLGMFQFDAGTFDDTLAREGSRILTIAGNTDAAVDFVVDMVIRSTYISGVSTNAEAIAWMNGVATDNSRLEPWAQTVTRYYNGCRETSSCWSERLPRYRSFAVNVHDEMGTTFWDVGGTPPPVPDAGTGTDSGTPPPTTSTYGAEFVGQSFPRAGSPFELAPGEERLGYFEFRNVGTTTWTPGFTFLGTVDPRDGASDFYGPDWTAPHRAASVPRSVTPGNTGLFEFTLRAPTVAGQYRQSFNLVEEGQGWFADLGTGPRDGDLTIIVDVIEGLTPGTGAGTDAGTDPIIDPPGADGGIGHPGDGRLSSGCSTTNVPPPTSYGLGFLVAIALFRRPLTRRRRVGRPEAAARRSRAEPIGRPQRRR